MTNLERILKSRDITLLTKVQIVKAIVFPVVMYGSESWTKKGLSSENFILLNCWCWRRLQISLDSKDIKPVNPKGNQS